MDNPKLPPLPAALVDVETEARAYATAAADACRDEFITSQLEYRARLEQARAKLDGVLLGEGWVVACEGVYLSFTITNGLVSDPRHTTPDQCMRFTRRDAERIAASVRNGRNTRGEALHILDALRQELDDCARSLRMVNEFKLHRRGAYDQEYQIYRACADDGSGQEITTGQPLKTYAQWLNS